MMYIGAGFVIVAGVSYFAGKLAEVDEIGQWIAISASAVVALGIGYALGIS
jgi:hypothetical protein